MKTTDEHTADTGKILCISSTRPEEGALELLQAIEQFIALAQPSTVASGMFRVVLVSSGDSGCFSDRYRERCMSAISRINQMSSPEEPPLRVLEYAAHRFRSEIRNGYFDQAEALFLTAGGAHAALWCRQFVALKESGKKALAVSTASTLWQQVGGLALALIPGDQDQNQETIVRALSMTEGERRVRMELLLNRVADNDILSWRQAGKADSDSEPNHLDDRQRTGEHLAIR